VASIQKLTSGKLLTPARNLCSDLPE
jgi:hypothetical protein